MVVHIPVDVRAHIHLQECLLWIVLEQTDSGLGLWGWGNHIDGGILCGVELIALVVGADEDELQCEGGGRGKAVVDAEWEGVFGDVGREEHFWVGGMWVGKERVLIVRPVVVVECNANVDVRLVRQGDDVWLRAPS